MEIIKTFGHITNDNGTFDVCLVDHLNNLWLATYDPAEDEIDTLCIVKDLDNAIEIANNLFQTQDEYVIDASTDIMAADEVSENTEILFTSAALLDFLCQIDELAEYGVSVEENGGDIKVKIGKSVYSVNSSDAQDVEAPAEVVDEISDINDEAYDEIANTDYEQYPDIPEDSPIEAGIISEALKTLAVGGMVRLTSKLLGKDVAETLLKGK